MEPTLGDHAGEANEQGAERGVDRCAGERMLSAIEPDQAGETEQDHEGVHVG